MQFVKANMKKMIAEEKLEGGAAAATKLLGARWKEMTDGDKKPYQELFEKDKVRYQSQMKEFRETGHWTMEDGTNSKDCKNTKLQRGKRVYA